MAWAGGHKRRRYGGAIEQRMVKIRACCGGCHQGWGVRRLDGVVLVKSMQRAVVAHRVIFEIVVIIVFSIVNSVDSCIRLAKRHRRGTRRGGWHKRWQLDRWQVKHFRRGFEKSIAAGVLASIDRLEVCVTRLVELVF